MSTKTLELENTETALVVAQPQQIAPTNLFGAADAVAVIDKARAVATALRDVIEQQGLVSTISGKKYPRCEAWTLLGTMLGIYPVLVWTKQIEGGWEARVEAKTRDGAVVGAAEAQCMKAERNWTNRDEFALRSMAQTRATSKALRMPLGFVMTLGGYEPTPAEEMVFDHPSRKPEKIISKPIAQSTKAIVATDKTRNWMIQELNAVENTEDRRTCTDFFDKCGIILPTEAIEDVPLNWVPVNKVELQRLKSAIMDFAQGGQAHMPYEQHGANPMPEAPKPIEVPRDPPSNPETSENGWFFKLVVPVPRKGQKRDEYLANPDTIGSLFEARHGEDADSQEARQRLWGFVNHYEPKGWKKRDGTEMPPSESDKKFREALDAFAEWFEKHHPGEKL